MARLVQQTTARSSLTGSKLTEALRPRCSLTENSASLSSRPLQSKSTACRPLRQSTSCLQKGQQRSKLQQQPSRSRHIACQAGGDDRSEPQKPNELSPEDSELFIQGSDTSFLIKLLFISIGGAAVVKYGSLLLDAPFQPDAGLGLTLVIGPCLIYSIALLYKSREESEQ